MRVRKRRFLDITHVSPYPCKIKLENNAGLPGSCNLGWMATPWLSAVRAEMHRIA